MSEFNKGDVVVLKSGGPKMTVSDVGDYSGMAMGPKEGVKCIWFETVEGVQRPQERVFDKAVLKKHVPGPSAAYIA